MKQSVVINIRGNKAYEHIKNFISVGLVIGKRAVHTKELKLSDSFFEYFHLVKKNGGVGLGVEGVEGFEKNEEQTTSGIVPQVIDV